MATDNYDIWYDDYDIWYKIGEHNALTVADLMSILSALPPDMVIERFEDEVERGFAVTYVYAIPGALVLM